MSDYIELAKEIKVSEPLEEDTIGNSVNTQSSSEAHIIEDSTIHLNKRSEDEKDNTFKFPYSSKNEITVRLLTLKK